MKELFTLLRKCGNLLQNQEWDTEDASQIATEVCGFVTILSGTFLHKTKDIANRPVELPVFTSTPQHDNSHSGT
ncbi:hypothetical protein glysoja_050181 [Glycine soja]|uniref:Uncharacterized protein n=1 Tax=Glycine soja TaxID=3848 RepID=A0A0B2Q0X3_GLYSO|nr:hypothetical protein glysoja_018467 [Glycine soja]KHN15231.1 hypothetical protein glysoja_050181 [Glycine soja]